MLYSTVGENSSTSSVDEWSTSFVWCSFKFLLYGSRNVSCLDSVCVPTSSIGDGLTKRTFQCLFQLWHVVVSPLRVCSHLVYRWWTYQWERFHISSKWTSAIHELSTPVSSVTNRSVRCFHLSACVPTSSIGDGLTKMSVRAIHGSSYLDSVTTSPVPSVMS